MKFIVRLIAFSHRAGFHVSELFDDDWTIWINKDFIFSSSSSSIMSIVRTRLIFSKMMIRFAELKKPTMISIYIWCELIVWSFMTYSAIYHGKMFDHDHVKTEEFVSNIEGNKGGNWYYRLMFGNLNLRQVDADQQHNIQGEMNFQTNLNSTFFLLIF